MSDTELTEAIIGCCFKVHSELGPGLLESAYQKCLCYELTQINLSVENEKSISLNYKGNKLDCGFRIDLLVENRIVVEIKSVEAFTDIHLAQILTYLKISRNRFGLLINFNVLRLRDGIKRVVNGY